MADISLIPDPAILINGLRDTGYDFNTSLADVIDNSVDAEATLIDVRILKDTTTGNLSVMVGDNGCGMNREELLNGMKYGSNPDKRDPRRLGKFGLGLKTASTAFCRRLSVLSKSCKADPILMATWDLDYVAREQSWKLILDEEHNMPERLVRIFNIIAKDGHGTLVVWEKVDRLGVKTRKEFDKIILSAENHLSMIFHRFLDPDFSDARFIKMVLNGKRVEAWDPFCRYHGMTEKNQETKKELTIVREDGNEKKASFYLCAYTLPNREDFEDGIAKARLSNANMGFYVYRENRMISSADWLGLRAKDPHQSLSRIEFAFDHALDSAFSIDIKKSKITLNAELADWIDIWSTPAIKFAEDRYRRKKNDKIESNGKGAHTSSDRNIVGKEEDLVKSNITPTSAVNLLTKEQKVEITNPNTTEGPLTITIVVPDDDKPGITIFPDRGHFTGEVLWEPTLKNGHHAVRINMDHPYYQKIYVPNHQDGLVMDGLDSLFWSLAEAENSAKYTPRTAEMFQDMRVAVSISLRRLVEDLPEPEVN